MTKIEIIGEERHHAKASEVYIDVKFRYGDKLCEWSIPIEYRRTGVHLADAEPEAQSNYVEEIYQICSPKNWEVFRREQAKFWAERPNASVTKAFFDVLVSDFTWKSVELDLPPNPNWSRRFQDLKEMGYTLATHTARFDPRLRKRTTQILLLPIPRGGTTGYEVWDPKLRDRIIGVLGNVDEFESAVRPKAGLLPDHKFPEIRWDADVKRDNLNELTDDEIRADFQLITNQRNQQKREVCRKCYQTGKRGTVFGVDYFYSGTGNWDESIPKRGKEAEVGCFGCAWYDLSTWRKSLNDLLDESD
jgi:hypothetical protein